ncbi:MAG: hypothetical protein Q4E65_06725, partial [Clostridia bacterium]|nr:hypothetical protein [Clostridia bacterium]
MKHAKGKNVPWLRVLLSAALALCALCLAAPLMGCKDYDDSATLEKLKEVKQNKDEATRKQDSTLQKDPAQQD